MYERPHAYRVMGSLLQFVSNINGKNDTHFMQNVFGLAAAVLVDDARLTKRSAQFKTLLMSQTSATRTPWKMNRSELVARLEELKVPIRVEWTVPELRATLLEALETRGDTKNKLVGITKMTFDQLKEKCLLEGIALPEKPTRGTMMKMLRDNLPPTDEEKVCFGSFKGYLYKEVNEGYLEWAQREVKENPNHSPDLARLARWAQARGDLPGAPSGSGDPELSAKVPVPKAVLPKAKAELKNPNKTTRTSRTRPVTSESDMGFSEVEMPMDQQIQDLEARLEIMRTVAKSEKEAAARMDTGASQK